MEDRIAALEARIPALEARIKQLEARERGPMKRSLQCPMCGGRTIHRSTSTADNFVLMHLGRSKGLIQRTRAGCYAHGCAECGFVELHAKFEGVDIENTNLETLVGEADTNDSGTPYR
ncbi:MAG: putative RNA-binding Zn-ribbon protein involved in translation (DUF1610 family) [Polyangiales bacterium]|jgi:predicted RNA-binding Zn-ribbon protein involved in translation (DUF1610 family)